MNSSIKNAVAITLGIAFGVLALAALSGAYATPAMSGPVQPLASNLVTNAGPSFAPANQMGIMKNQNQTIASIANPTAFPLTIILLTAISLVIALGASIGISKRMNRYRFIRNSS